MDVRIKLNAEDGREFITPDDGETALFYRNGSEYERGPGGALMLRRVTTTRVESAACIFSMMTPEIFGALMNEYLAAKGPLRDSAVELLKREEFRARESNARLAAAAVESNARFAAAAGMCRPKPVDMYWLKPVDMLLWCPYCNLQHIDAPEPHRFVDGKCSRCGKPSPQTLKDFDSICWNNPPHRSHLCKRCGHIWRVSDVPTNGVKEIKTKGEEDGTANPGKA